MSVMTKSLNLLYECDFQLFVVFHPKPPRDFSEEPLPFPVLPILDDGKIASDLLAPVFVRSVRVLLLVLIQHQGSHALERFVVGRSLDQSLQDWLVWPCQLKRLGTWRPLLFGEFVRRVKSEDHAR